MQDTEVPHLDCHKAGRQPLGIDSCLQGILSVSCLHEHTQIAVQYEDTYKAVCGHMRTHTYEVEQSHSNSFRCNLTASPDLPSPTMLRSRSPNFLNVSLHRIKETLRNHVIMLSACN